MRAVLAVFGDGDGVSLADTNVNYSHLWYTPPDWIDWIVRTFGVASYDDVFDPCPQDWQGADGLSIPWQWPAYCNHPGGRGSVAKWWRKYLVECLARVGQALPLQPFIWCAFNPEQYRYMRPSALELPGWLVMPRDRRIDFCWGGPTYQPPKGKPRVHGQPSGSPGHCTTFWSTVEPAEPPVDCIITRTGR